MTEVQLLINLDVPDLEAAERFYTHGLGLVPGRWLEGNILELTSTTQTGLKLYLLKKPEATQANPLHPTLTRRYQRHWTPVHLDFVVENLDSALQQALAAGAKLETGPDTQTWGKIASLSDPFGHGFCLIEFLNQGYDEITLRE